MTKKTAEFDQFQVRLPPGMREQLRQDAEASGRSMNAEIVSRIEQSYEIPEMKEIAQLLRQKTSLLEERVSQLTRNLEYSDRAYDATHKTVKMYISKAAIAALNAAENLQILADAASGETELLNKKLEFMRDNPGSYDAIMQMLKDDIRKAVDDPEVDYPKREDLIKMYGPPLGASE